MDRKRHPLNDWMIMLRVEGTHFREPDAERALADGVQL
jgi:hypothetical protein